MVEKCEIKLSQIYQTLLHNFKLKSSLGITKGNKKNKFRPPTNSTGHHIFFCEVLVLVGSSLGPMS
jgi:hypothetical protein